MVWWPPGGEGNREGEGVAGAGERPARGGASYYACGMDPFSSLTK